MYLSEAEILDKEISESCKEGMDSVVIFVSFWHPIPSYFPRLKRLRRAGFFQLQSQCSSWKVTDYYHRTWTM